MFRSSELPRWRSSSIFASSSRTGFSNSSGVSIRFSDMRLQRREAGATVACRALARVSTSGDRYVLPVGQRMALFHDPPQPLLQHMRVDLCGGDVRMSQHLLQAPEVGAVLEQMRRERMSQNVRRHPFRRDTRLDREMTEDLAQPPPRKMAFGTP